jgi:ADP-ribose pyrophosphatase YjhB (NUDIX family)
MSQAARAIIFENNKILVMHREKYGSQYFTLVGGRVNEGETLEQALVREVKEETGLDVIAGRQVFIEKHQAPYNEQYIYLCQVGPHADVAIQDSSEEGFMNRLDANIHTPLWVDIQAFAKLSFRTPQLQAAILQALQKGFPEQPVRLS